MFRQARILALLLILFAVAVNTWRSDAQVTSWKRTVNVAIYPIAADASPETARFIRELDDDSFNEIEDWLQAEAKRYGVNVKDPLAIRLGPQIHQQPPLPPRSSNMPEAILWSLKMRWWAYRNSNQDKFNPQVRLFVLFHGDQTVLPHSVGITQGKIGVIHVFSNPKQARQNAVIIAHELLHTFGATDKYNFATLQPLYPLGYAEPERQPLLPQDKAEIMGGRIPVSHEKSRIPDDLTQTLIGTATAYEIRLLPTR